MKNKKRCQNKFYTPWRIGAAVEVKYYLIKNLVHGSHDLCIGEHKFWKLVLVGVI